MKNKEYAESFNGMKEKLREAFQPMVDVFTAVMPKIYDFISAIADMAIKFNEAHPTLAKIIQGFLMLLPAVTLLLSPLAVGIGLFGGLAASWAALAPLIMPLVAGIAAISGPVLLVTAGIVALTAAGVYLYRNWDTVKLKTTELWSKLGEFKGIATLILGPLGLIIRAAVTMASNWDSTKSVWENVWNGIKLAASSAVNDVIGSINAMIAHINKIPGVNVPIIAKVSWGQTKPPAEYSRSVGQGRQTSHAGGLSHVPYDGYSASLHRGERVLTARENKEYSSGKGASSISIGDIHLHGVAGDMEKAADQLMNIMVKRLIQAEGA
jgi:phage-related protein